MSNRFGRMLKMVRREGWWGVFARLQTQWDSLARAAHASRRSLPPARGAPKTDKESRYGILAVDYRVPKSNFSAGDAAAVETLREFRRQGYSVTFLPRYLGYDDAYSEELRSAGIEVITRGMGFRTAREFVHVRANKFAAAYISRLEVAEEFLPLIRRCAPHVCVIFQSPDLKFVRERREAEVSRMIAQKRRAERTRRREFAVMHSADHVVVISDVEARILSGEISNEKISVCGILQFSIRGNGPAFESRRNVCFLGGFGHNPNVDAVMWFADHVWPDIVSRIPDVEFHIIGSEMPDSIRDLASRRGIRPIGYVEELEPAIETFRVGVAPLRIGAGIKGKIAVMLGAGLPCIATGIAAEGMGLTDDIDVLIRDDAAEFAEAVISLYEDGELWNKLADAGRRTIGTRYGPEARRNAVTIMLRKAGISGVVGPIPRSVAN